jgi:hypothetical protein
MQHHARLAALARRLHQRVEHSAADAPTRMDGSTARRPICAVPGAPWVQRPVASAMPKRLKAITCTGCPGYGTSATGYKLKWAWAVLSQSPVRRRRTRWSQGRRSS